MLRVIFVTGSLAHGGAERHAISLVNRLAERGHECHVSYIKDESAQLPRVQLRDPNTALCLDAARYLDARALLRLAGQIARIQPSAVIAVNSYALMYCWLALRMAHLRMPLAVTFHSTRLLTFKEQLQMAAYRCFFRTADCLIFVCDAQKRFWLRRGLSSRRNEVIYNGVDTEEFCEAWNAEARKNLRSALGCCDKDYVIGMAAVLRPEKNHVQLVDAVASLRKQGIAARALMIGDGPMRAAVETRARWHGIERHITITGFQQDVRPYLAACDVVALCSLTETFSLAAVEAMALCKPVVHSDVGGAAEIVVNGQTGFLFPVGDIRALIESLALLADRALCQRMGNSARQAVRARFSETTMVNRYEKVLLELS